MVTFWNALSGKKTYLTAILLALLGVNEEFKFLTGEHLLLLKWLVGALGLTAVGHKLAKLER